MNRLAAFLFFMLFLAGLALLMLPDLKHLPQQGTASIVSGRWLLTGATAEQPWLEFSAAGSLTGFGGCNTLSGRFVATDLSIEINDLATTRKACAPSVMHRERAMLGTLSASSGYSIAARTLELRTNDGEKLSFTLQDADNL